MTASLGPRAALRQRLRARPSTPCAGTQPLAAATKTRWIRKQSHQQLKEELGLDHFEGRFWTALHPHALMTMIDYAFLQSRRLFFRPSGKKEAPGRCLSPACLQPGRRSSKPSDSRNPCAVRTVTDHSTAGCPHDLPKWCQAARPMIDVNFDLLSHAPRGKASYWFRADSHRGALTSSIRRRWRRASARTSSNRSRPLAFNAAPRRR